jgi:hypothetical protein
VVVSSLALSDGTELSDPPVTDINKQAITVEEARSLDPSGREMIVEVMLTSNTAISQGRGSALAELLTRRGINVFVKARGYRTCGRWRTRCQSSVLAAPSRPAHRRAEPFVTVS